MKRGRDLDCASWGVSWKSRSREDSFKLEKLEGIKR